MEKASTSPRGKIIFGTTFSHKHLKKLFPLSTILAIFLLSACEKEIEEIQRSATDLSKDQVPADVLEKIGALGFGTKGVIVIPEGYLVEGDIILSKEDLIGAKKPSNARIEQYRTTHLVTNLPRTITVSIASSLPGSYEPALDEAIQRYNDQGIQLSLSRVTTGANISIVPGTGSYLASAGFPSASGNPYSEIKVNASAIGTTPNVDYLATILAHEIGHCIGFRHTDYMDRSYSCGGSYTNEGPSTVGAEHVPGTPTTADPGSWMLSCIGSGINRPFNTADQLSLRTLYGNSSLPNGPSAQGDDMKPGEVLYPDQFITSANGRYKFIYQSDGNLVLYDGSRPLWASSTNGQPRGVCIMQDDGNLVIYIPGGRPIWASNTAGNPHSRLVVQDDGNVVIYSPNGKALWSTETWIPNGPSAQGDDMKPGEVLYPDQFIMSANGRYKFIYQSDGNLVLYDGSRPLWASSTNGQPRGVCIMQDDGNLVIYIPGGRPIWASNTAGNPHSRLVVQDDGNVVIYSPNGKALWATNTVQS